MAALFAAWELWKWLVELARSRSLSAPSSGVWACEPPPHPAFYLCDLVMALICVPAFLLTLCEHVDAST